MKEWDSLSEGPKREHVATAAAREQWLNTYCFKANDRQVEQAPLPPPSTPICRKLKIGIENMFVDTRDNTQTQQQSSHVYTVG